MVLVGQIARSCGLHKVLKTTTLFHDVLLSLYGLIVQGQKALAAKGLLPVKTDVERKCLRKVIDDLTRIGCKLTRHGMAVFLCIWEKDPWLPVFRELHRSFEAL
ncbi:MAG: hypothetical protein LDL24_10820 [Treponema sp.]|nr:hypothetical protein [Treponema sp.]